MNIHYGDKNFLLLNNTYTGSSTRIETMRLFLNMKHKTKWYLKSKHSTLEELKDIINLNDYRIITFVRNPYDRFISIFVRNKIIFQNIEEYISEEYFKILLKNFIRYKKNMELQPNQTNMVLLNNKLRVDYIGRYENMDRDWELCCDKYGLPYTKLKIPKPNNVD